MITYTDSVALLIKGSRGMEMEHLILMIKEKCYPSHSFKNELDNKYNRI